MRRALLSLVLSLSLLAASGPALAIECEDWERLEGGKESRVERLIDARLQSNQGKKYTSANRVDIRSCAMRFVPDIVAQFDGACAQGMAASMNVLDEIFDKYFLSCVR
ncbi:MAG: hypothetical protein QNK04_11320 [Myxococcota bacterium]|nr:hypothetical protein [Myxococcota bacterium]